MDTSKTNVGLSKTNLELSKTNVGLSKTNVGLSKTNVGLSKTNVGLSKTNVGLSKTNVGLSKTNVGISKTNVGLSKTNVTISKTNLDISGSKADIAKLKLDLGSELAVSDPETPQSRKKKKERKKRRKEIAISRIPGVRRIPISELTQKTLGCVVGEHVTSEKQWLYIDKELIQDNLELYEDSSDFLPIKLEIIAFPGTQMLLGYVADETGEADEFYICTTIASTEAVQTLITEMQKKQEARLYNSINKTILPWKNLGSDIEVDDTIPCTTRSLIEVEIESKYPILPFKVEFRLRTVEKAKDGYMELLNRDELIIHVYRRRVDCATQVTAPVVDNEAQTICSYPRNASTQYEYSIEIDEMVWKSYGQIIQNYLRKNSEEIFDFLNVNRNINLYADDYKVLAKGESSEEFLTQSFIEYMAFIDVILCKGKMISCAQWHRLWSGVVAIAYADIAGSLHLKRLHTEDEVLRAVHGVNPVLIWSFLDPLNARLILETHREITTISFCPFNEDVVIGGAVNGQIIIWDIQNKIKRVEEQEILTEAQQKYRSYMRSLMGWMKDIQDLKKIRPAAVSDLRYSHSSAVARIQWISPFEEVGRTGKARQFPSDSEERSLQFITAGEDGVVMIWDLLKRPSAVAGGFKERQLKRLAKRPDGLSMEISPFRDLHLNLRPIYKINIMHPSQNRLIAASIFCYKNVPITYENLNTKSDISISERQIFTATPIRPEREFVSRLYLGTMEGDFCEITWEGHDFDLGAVVNSETCGYRQFAKVHGGPVLSLARHPMYDVTLSVGGKVFAIWSDNLKDRPVFWRICRTYYTAGSWYKSCPSRFRLLRSDGVYELWCITSSSKKATNIIPLSSAALTTSNVHARKLSSNILGLSDAHGSFRIFHLHEQIIQGVHEETMEHFIDREVRRKTNFYKWQTDWHEKHAKKEEIIEIVPQTSADIIAAAAAAEVEEEVADVEESKDEPEKKEKPKEEKQKTGGGRYLEWLKAKEIAKEQDRIKKMILKKKNLDTEELERQRQPLLKLEEENEIRKKKQRARIKGSENIFNETVAMLFPAIVKEKPIPPPDPYAGGEPLKTKEVCYLNFQEACQSAQIFVEENPYKVQFNWKYLIQRARKRRKYLDNTFSKAIHSERFMRYKSARSDGIAIAHTSAAPLMEAMDVPVVDDEYLYIPIVDDIAEENIQEHIEEAATEEAATEKPATKEAATEETATEEAATEEAAIEGAATEEAATEGAATEGAATEETEK